MKEREIFEKLTPEPTTLLGLKLLPFSLGHLLLLHRVESAFVMGGRPEYEDLALAVFICSRTYEDALSGFSDPTLPEQMEQWAHMVSGEKWSAKRKRWEGKGTPIDLDAKCLAFNDYLHRHNLVLEEGKDFIFGEAGSGRKIALPFAHVVRVKLQSRMRFSDAEIFNRAWALCLLDYYALADLDGAIALTDGESIKRALKEAQQAADKVAELVKVGKLQIPA